MDICNIKFHCKIKPELLLLFVSSFKNRGYKKFPSFEILKFGKFLFVCYYSGFVNITGLKNISEINASLVALRTYLQNYSLEFEGITIDNITAKCTCVKQKRICLQEKKEKIKLMEYKGIIYGVKYEREVFPNMFIKTKHATLIWSSNNKVSCVGLKSADMFNELCLLIKELAKL